MVITSNYRKFLQYLVLCCCFTSCYCLTGDAVASALGQPLNSTRGSQENRRWFTPPWSQPLISPNPTKRAFPVNQLFSRIGRHGSKNNTLNRGVLKHFPYLIRSNHKTNNNFNIGFNTTNNPINALGESTDLYIHKQHRDVAGHVKSPNQLTTNSKLRNRPNKALYTEVTILLPLSNGSRPTRRGGENSMGLDKRSSAKHGHIDSGFGRFHLHVRLFPVHHSYFTHCHRLQRISRHFRRGHASLLCGTSWPCLRDGFGARIDPFLCVWHIWLRLIRYQNRREYHFPGKLQNLAKYNYNKLVKRVHALRDIIKNKEDNNGEIRRYFKIIPNLLHTFQVLINDFYHTTIPNVCGEILTDGIGVDQFVPTWRDRVRKRVLGLSMVRRNNNFKPKHNPRRLRKREAKKGALFKGKEGVNGHLKTQAIEENLLKDAELDMQKLEIVRGGENERANVDGETRDMVNADEDRSITNTEYYPADRRTKENNWVSDRIGDLRKEYEAKHRRLRLEDFGYDGQHSLNGETKGQHLLGFGNGPPKHQTMNQPDYPYNTKAMVGIKNRRDGLEKDASQITEDSRVMSRLYGNHKHLDDYGVKGMDIHSHSTETTRRGEKKIEGSVSYGDYLKAYKKLMEKHRQTIQSYTSNDKTQDNDNRTVDKTTMNSRPKPADETAQIEEIFLQDLANKKKMLKPFTQSKHQTEDFQRVANNENFNRSSKGAKSIHAHHSSNPYPKNGNTHPEVLPDTKPLPQYSQHQADVTVNMSSPSDNQHPNPNHVVNDIIDEGSDAIVLNKTAVPWHHIVHGRTDLVVAGCVIAGIGLLVLGTAFVSRLRRVLKKDGKERYRNLGNEEERYRLKDSNFSLFVESSDEEDGYESDPV